MKPAYYFTTLVLSIFTIFLASGQKTDRIPFGGSYQDSLFEHWASQYDYVTANLEYDNDSVNIELGDFDNLLVTDSIIKHRLEALNKTTPFSFVYNDKVLAFIKLYLRRTELTGNVLGLSDFYFPLFEATLDKYEMPLELKNLAIVESALKPVAKSRASAVGLWQFMYYTGKMYNLNVTSYVDERRDPVKATEAACQYLGDLYKMFDNWELALAAYNSGPGNVNKAIRYAGGKRNYWEIYQYLPRETRGYVPAFIAVNYVMTYYKEHGIKPIKPQYLYHEIDTTMVTANLDLAFFSESLGVPKEELAALNPELKTDIVPGAIEPYPLKMPYKASQLYASIKDSLKVQYRKENPEIVAYKEIDQYITHRVRRGEVLGSIASRYNVSVSNIRNWNRLRSNMIRTGQNLVIYKKQRVAVTAANEQLAKKAEATEKKKTEEPAKEVAQNNSKEESFRYYTVQPGDTLWGIAQKLNGVSVEKLKSLNDLSNAKRLKPGQKLKIGEHI